MKSNNTQVRNAVKAHILQSVYNYEGNEFETFEEAKNHLKAEFERVANYPYNLKKFPNTQDRFADYLAGLPFNFEFETYKQEEFINGLGINPTNKEYSSDKVNTLYSYLIFKEI